MGNAESTLAFKAQFSQLSKGDLTEKDSLWQSIVSPTGSHHQVFGVLSDADIRKVRTLQPQNLETLLKLLILQLSSLLKPTGVGPTLEEQVLWSLRALERLVPFMFENKQYAQSIRGLLWTEEALLKLLIDLLLKLAQQPGFCVALKGPVVWTEGIGAELVPPPSKQNQYNRVELLRCLDVVLSEPLYNMEPNGLDYLVEKPPSDIATLFCSVINTALKPSLSLFAEDPSQLALASILLLVVQDSRHPNNFRRLASKTRVKDLDLVKARGCSELLTASLTWEFCQANVNFTIDSVEGVVDLIQLKQYTQESDFVRILCCLLLTESKSPDWSSQHANSIMGLFAPFNNPSLHLPALLDILYNISPFVDLSSAACSQFNGFVQSISISTAVDQKQSLASSIRNMLDSNSAINLAKLKFKLGDEWLDQYMAQLEGTSKPPTANPEVFRPIEFGWDAASIKWYKSVLWGQFMQLAEITTGVSPWTQTDIHMFKVERVQQRPTLRNPKGAVDAVGGAVGNMIWGWFERARDLASERG